MSSTRSKSTSPNKALKSLAQTKLSGLSSSDSSPEKAVRSENFPLGQACKSKSRLHLGLITDVAVHGGKETVTIAGRGRTSISVDSTSCSSSASLSDQASMELGDDDELDTIDDPDQPFVVSRIIYETSHSSPIYAAAFDHYQPDDATPVFATAARNIVNVYNCPRGNQKIVYSRAFVDDNNEESFFALTWAYDTVEQGHRIVVGGFCASIKVIDPASGRLTKELLGHGDVINELRTDPNNSMIVASVSKDTTLRIWNIRIGICLVICGGLEGHLDQVLSCDWSPDSYFLVSCGMDHSIRMWYLTEPAQKLLSYSMNPEGELAIRERQPDSPKEVQCVHINFPNALTSDLHFDYVDCVRFYGWHVISKGSERAANLFRFGHTDDAVDHIFEIKADTACTRLGTFNLPSCDVWFLKFDIDPTGKWIAFGSKTGIIYFFDIKGRDSLDEEADYTVSIGPAPIRQLSFGANGQILIAVSDDYSVTRLERKRRGERLVITDKTVVQSTLARQRLSKKARIIREDQEN